MCAQLQILEEIERMGISGLVDSVRRAWMPSGMLSGMQLADTGTTVLLLKEAGSRGAEADRLGDGSENRKDPLHSGS